MILKPFFLALTDCKFAVRYNSLILFDFGDSPNLPATSKKAALPSRVRARFGCLLACPYVLRTLFPHARAFCQPARAGLALLQKSAIFGRGPNLQQSREYPEKLGRGNTRRKKGRQKHALSRCLSHKKAAKKDAKES